jgi:hypothetical protein
MKVVSVSALLFLTMLFNVNAQAVGSHDAQCQAQWYRSSASAQCTGSDWTTQAPPGTCNFHQMCIGTGEVIKDAAHTPSKDRVTKDRNHNDLSVSLDDAGKLSNCNGVLKVGGC